MPSKIIKYWAPAICWACLIFYFSSLSNIRVPLSEYPNADKFMHTVEYFIFGFLLARLTANSGLPPWRTGGARCSALVRIPPFPPLNKGGLIFLSAFLIAFTYGATDELHQYFVPGRQCSLWDFLVDGIGGGLGAYVYSLRYLPHVNLERVKNGEN